MLGRDTQSPQILGRVRAEHGGVGRYERLILKPQTSTGKGPQWIGNVASLHRTVGSDNGLLRHQSSSPVLIGGLIARAFIRSHAAAGLVLRVGTRMTTLIGFHAKRWAA